MTDVLKTNFHWLAFVTACFIGCLPEAFGIFTSLMKSTIKKIIVNTIENSREYSDIEQRFKDITRSQIDDFLEKKFSIEDPAGKIIGLIERILYTYALFSQETVIIGGILTFKAFSGWVSSYDKENPRDTKELHIVLEFLVKTRGLNALYLYTYAIGNFMSLIISVFSFEIVIYAMQHSQHIKAILLAFDSINS